MSVQCLDSLLGDLPTAHAVGTDSQGFQTWLPQTAAKRDLFYSLFLIWSNLEMTGLPGLWQKQKSGSTKSQSCPLRRISILSYKRTLLGY